MPANLFDPASRPAPVGGRRRLTVTTSIAVHAAVVLIIVIAPLIGGVTLPSAMSRIEAFVTPATLPPVQAPQPPATATRPTVAPNPDAAPIHAPDTIAPEVNVPVPGVPQVPGALPVATGYGVPSAAPGASVVVIAPPAPRPPELVRPGGKVREPKRIAFVPPVYPPIAASARIEGTVILEAIIDETGAVTNLKVLRSIPLLDAAAKEAVSQWRYSPTTLNGVNVAVIMTVTVTFTLK
jgi:protein TonB